MNILFQALKADPNTANAFGALASAAAAVLALLVSVISVIVSVKALRTQQHHNTLSVRPLPEITVADYENGLRVRLRNNGSGPLIVKSISVANGPESHGSIIDWMPRLPRDRAWTTFVQRIDRRGVLPGAFISLIELNEETDISAFAESRDLVRKALAPLTVFVDYSDIYGTKFPLLQKSLNWFGRHWGHSENVHRSIEL